MQEPTRVACGGPEERESKSRMQTTTRELADSEITEEGSSERSCSLVWRPESDVCHRPNAGAQPRRPKGRLRRREREQAGTVTGARRAVFGFAHAACQARFLRRVSYQEKRLRTGALSDAALG